MRPVVIENLNKAIEACSLLQEVETVRSGRLLLQSQVHTFMATVVLRVPGLDPLDRDPET